MRDKKLTLLIAILFIKAIVIVLIILFGNIGLSPDEAQYWTWSRALDFGYYSKPPGIAWEIFLGSSIFGNSELGVKFFSLIIGFLLPIAVYFLSVASGLKKETAFWCGMMMAFSPLGFAASFFATTDGSMVLFWTLASIFMCKGLTEEKTPNFLLMGLMIALGALFKWPIYLFWIFPLLIRRFWGTQLILGMLISLIGLLPSIIWNFQHDFATFRHVFSTVKGAENTSQIFHGNFLEFLGAQAGLVSPILFILFLISVVYFIRHRKQMPKAIQFCFVSSFGILLLFAIAASFKKMQGNWAIFVYPAAFVLTGFICFEKMKSGKLWIQIGVALSILLTALVISIPLLKFNVFKHNMGWDQLPLKLQEAGYNPDTDFLFGDKYQTSSLLSFYSPKQKRAYFLNLQGIRKNQFSYWTSMQKAEMGKTGYFVVVENSPKIEKEAEAIVAEYEKSLSPYFKKVEFMGIKPLFSIAGKPVKGAFIFKGTDYNGNEPKESSLY